MEQEKEQSTLKLELEYWLATTGSSQWRQKKKLGNFRRKQREYRCLCSQVMTPSYHWNRYVDLTLDKGIEFAISVLSLKQMRIPSQLLFSVLLIWKSHLYESAFCLPQLNADPQRDADHGRESHHPPYAIAPVRVCIYIVIFQRLVFHQEENEDSLK